MKINGKFRTNITPIPVKSLTTPITLLVFGDVHMGSPNFCSKKWQKFLERAKSAKNSYLLGMGDFFDFASTSERHILKSGLHEATEATLDKVARSMADEMIHDLEKTRKPLLGLIEGNHHYELKDGTTTTEYMCSKLGTAYLGVAGLQRLQFDYGGGRCSLDIFAHHGAGASRLPGGSINRVHQMTEIIDADIYLMGHDHKRISTPTSRLYMDQNGVVKQRTVYLGRTGSFLRAYDPQGESYVVDACLPPSELGWLEFELRLYREKGRDGRGFGVDIVSRV